MAITCVDLHCHSTASDGTLPPRQVVQLAKKSGLSALALTDHDTVAGIAEAADEASLLGIDFLPGIEISGAYPKPGTLHLLGYGINAGSESLKQMMRTLVACRDARNDRIIDVLQAQGVAIFIAEVIAIAGGDVIGRPHFARVLMQKGYVSSLRQAFEKYLGQPAVTSLTKERLTPAEAIGTIHAAGGLAVLAHPSQLRTQNAAELETAIKSLCDLGLDGLEVIHSDHDDALIDNLHALAKKFGLLETGGSDFHGVNKKDIQLGRAGGRPIPRDFFDKLLARLRSLSPSRLPGG